LAPVGKCQEKNCHFTLSSLPAQFSEPFRQQSLIFFFWNATVGTKGLDQRRSFQKYSPEFSFAVAIIFFTSLSFFQQDDWSTLATMWTCEKSEHTAAMFRISYYGNLNQKFACKTAIRSLRVQDAYWTANWTQATPPALLKRWSRYTTL
jgi:hypothetical protein